MNTPIILLAAALGVGLGFLWYQKLFFTQYMHSLKVHVDRSKQRGMPLYEFFFSLATAGVLALFLEYTILPQWCIPLLVWAGFVLPTQAQASVWEDRPWNHTLISAGYRGAAIILMTLVLVKWG